VSDKDKETVQIYKDFFLHLNTLKHIPRTGWVRYRIPDPESVAEHSFKSGLMAMVLADNLDVKVNKHKLLKMALMHDIGESVIGDWVIYKKGGVIDRKAKKEKDRRELIAVKRIFSKIPNGKEYINLFIEFNQQKTKEAKIFAELDRLELALQAAEYEDKYGGDLSEFFETANNEIHTKQFRQLLKELIKRRGKK
jgi:putative hydrolases of HD superfamily